MTGKTVGVRPSAGFTLIELMVVLLIGVLLLTVVPPMISGGSGATLRSAAREIATGLRVARNEAVTQQSPAAFVLDLKAHRFKVSGQGSRSLDEGLELALNTAESEVVDAQKGRIRFFPDGSATGGSVDVVRDAQGYRVNVEWLTGRVEIVDYPGRS